MDFTGKCIKVFDLESGTSKTGNPWSKQSWLIEVPGQFPRTVKVDAMGRAVENVKMEVGKEYTVSVDLESREWNGRYYTDVRVYRAVEAAPQGAANAGASQAPADPFGGQPFPPAPAAPTSTPFPPADPTDDLPF